MAFPSQAALIYSWASGGGLSQGMVSDCVFTANKAIPS